MKQAARDIAQFLALDAQEKRVLLAAAFWMPLFWLGLRVVGLARLQSWLRGSRVKPRNALTLEAMREIGRLVNVAAARTLGPANCLTRSLLLTWLLHRKGVESQLRIGVRLSKGELAAHAWVEFNGVPLNDRPDVGNEFLPFADLVPLEAFQA